MEALMTEHPELTLALAEYINSKQILDSEKKRRYGQLFTREDLCNRGVDDCKCELPPKAANEQAPQ